MTKTENIKKLEKVAEEILRLKQEIGQRRPILIEFCGIPKSGKTSCITALNIFLKRNGFKTIVLTERASVCPVPMKTHPYFNVWTACSAIAEIVKNVSLGDDSVDVIIADRAIFDALCWFEWQNTNPSISNPHLLDDDYTNFQSFLTTDMFTRLIDLVYIFKASPEVAMQREYAYLLTEKRGSIMNERMLESYEKAIDGARSKNDKHFRRVEEIDTTKLGQIEVSYNVTETILNILRDMLIEKIGYFDEAALRSKLSSGVNDWSMIEDKTLKFDKRTVVENSSYIQPIPVCLITNPERDKILVLKKNSKKVTNTSPEKDKLLLYAGGHIREEDQGRRESSLITTLKNGLNREIQEELGEAISVNKISPRLIYTPTSDKSEKHLAVCFEVVMDLTGKKFNPNPGELLQRSGKTLSGQIVAIDDLVRDHTADEFDSWSVEILKVIFDRSFSSDQVSLFNGEY